MASASTLGATPAAFADHGSVPDHRLAAADHPAATAHCAALEHVGVDFDDDTGILEREGLGVNLDQMLYRPSYRNSLR
ncbi:hypothetical protein [Streptomyces sp. NPDC052127]|uniref:hypothetical protein n=1 Tax=Streptomyces sp. NPDC052127 TaxID=3155679 RepID=UPI0034447820